MTHNIKDIRLSDTDRQILGLLQQDARRSVSEIAHTVGLSRATARQRIEVMKSAGVIKKFTIELGDQLKMKSPRTVAFLHLQLKRPVCKLVYETIRGWPELLGSWSVAGELDMVLQVETTSTEGLEILREKLARHPEVVKMLTFPVLREWQNRG